MHTITIYLAGNINKSHKKHDNDHWDDEAIREIIETVSPVNVDFLNPSIRTDNLADQKSVFGRDMLQVYCSDVVFVDARQRRGLGVGAEMMWAKLNTIPVITLCPLDSHYYKSQTSVLNIPVNSWMHPFVENLSDHVAPTIKSGALWIKEYISNNKFFRSLKGPAFIKEAIQYYQLTQYPNDAPMKVLLDNNQNLKERFQSLSEITV